MDHGAALPDVPVPIHWTIHASTPIDHLDLRIHRTAGPDFHHFVYRPDALDRIATTTTFLPSTDPDPSVPPGFTGTLAYEIVLVAVDRLGRSSGTATTQVSVRRDTEPGTGDRKFFIDESGVIHFTPIEMELDTVSGTTITTAPFRRMDGVLAVGFTPQTLAGQTGGASVTFLNLDTAPHHLRSVYTSPYREDPFLRPAEHAIGGLLPLDFGVVAPGASATITLPASIPANYRWTLMDALDTTPLEQRPPKVILTTEPPRSATSSPIGG